MKVGLRYIALVTLTVFATACGLHIKEGEVVDKNYVPEHTQHYMMTIPHTVCTSGYKGATTCTTTYTYIPMTRVVPDSWSVKIEGCGIEGDPPKEKCDHRWVNVKESIYNKLSIGQWYKINDKET